MPPSKTSERRLARDGSRVVGCGQAVLWHEAAGWDGVPDRFRSGDV